MNVEFIYDFGENLLHIEAEVELPEIGPLYSSQAPEDREPTGDAEIELNVCDIVSVLDNSRHNFIPDGLYEYCPDREYWRKELIKLCLLENNIEYKTIKDVEPL